ncbi:N-acetylmuramoyl-L-alanine amidase [Lysinibacillus sphaericus]|uniref:glycoside hydrolase family 73 protein n=1 Tax=Lysinibacillus sphaericus TaxID=1421 RepID=UPI0018CDAC76|nr:glycoside hydrolase family 73 protein [Lysinibacillus sphaericus]MBG9455911.1 N-acetylmuramoyl-L-alanine amidase [Lysinibacillus sphaericus]MBG9479676.1 N-acetylmuramoyl-L-alanine amidase [Lysinibacillus sphaericus]MBG9593458.1 N-acetylmuramoyl-L-alanine amidase [Lysinibacillus sphaericus]
MKKFYKYRKNKVSIFLLVVGLVLLSIFFMRLFFKENREIRFIDEIAPIAVELNQQTGGVLPSITIAQAILESNYGESELAITANNLFGIKGSYKGNSVKMPTVEYKNNKSYTIEAEFRAYPDLKSALIDHTKLILEGTSWNKHQYYDVLAATNYREAAHALKKNHYATDPMYPEKLIDIIEQYNLDKYDN